MRYYLFFICSLAALSSFAQNKKFNGDIARVVPENWYEVKVEGDVYELDAGKKIVNGMTIGLHSLLKVRNGSAIKIESDGKERISPNKGEDYLIYAFDIKEKKYSESLYPSGYSLAYVQKTQGGKDNKSEKTIQFGLDEIKNKNKYLKISRVYKYKEEEEDQSVLFEDYKKINLFTNRSMLKDKSICFCIENKDTVGCWVNFVLMNKDSGTLKNLVKIDNNGDTTRVVIPPKARTIIETSFFPESEKVELIAISSKREHQSHIIDNKVVKCVTLRESKPEEFYINRIDF